MVLTVAMMVLVFVDAWFLLSVYVSESMVVVMAISSVRWWWFRRWRDVGASVDGDNILVGGAGGVAVGSDCCYPDRVVAKKIVCSLKPMGVPDAEIDICFVRIVWNLQ